MKTFEECCREVLQKNHPERDHLHDELTKIAINPTVTQAAELYAQEKLKRILEEVRFASNQWQAKSDHETDNANKAAYSTIAYAVGRIGTRIEELITSSQRQGDDTATN